MQMASQAKTNTPGDLQNLVSLCIVQLPRMSIRCCEIISSQLCMTTGLYILKCVTRSFSLFLYQNCEF